MENKMNKDNQKFLNEVFYKYWMMRVPELDELEAIDHLEWELRSMEMGFSFKHKGNKEMLNNFLKEKKVKYRVK